ncbi:permease prefix domain 1-containing protein [Paenibacillus eucommiae]|uniref:Tetrahydromethanopterin S-methyltransferase subunit B n=1 Tax=Paenibacillus eucommiae TaxID=1355755 RepID=A0ABS4IQW7_9BACL|nr:permease prefix domain 1-containing protein [Paenibacillus eucommiae]MBP1989967.1 tetrahydromethanopterin S-methyltransferase subunit B [Paenibacillus eucommiae]
MKRIDDFLNRLYQDSGLDPREIKDMKEEMRTHLYAYIEEAKQRGLTDNQAIEEAIENFGQEEEIFADRFDDRLDTQVSVVKAKSKQMISAIVILSTIILLAITAWGVKQLNQHEREVFYNGVSGALFMNEQPDMDALKKEVDRAIEEKVIKDVVITRGTHSSSPIIYKTIDSEGFPQDDSIAVTTKIERIPAIYPNQEDVYLVAYSYNILRFGSVLQLAFLLCIAFVLTYIARIRGRR